MQLSVLRPNGPLPGDSEPGPECRHVAAEVEGRIVGSCSICPAAWPHPQVTTLPEPTWQLRSMAVLPDFRGGTGTQLLSAAVDLAWRSGAACLWANARVAALGLYRRCGWTVVGEQWQKPGVGPHRWITLMRL